VTTDNTHPENSDWQVPVVEQLSVSETSILPVTLGASLTEEQVPVVGEQIKEAPTEAVGNEKTPMLDSKLLMPGDGVVHLLTSDNQEHQLELSMQPSFEFEVVFPPAREPEPEIRQSDL